MTDKSSDDIPELTEADFARMITRAQRRQLVDLFSKWSVEELTAFTKYLAMTKNQRAAVFALAGKKESHDV